MNEKEVFKKAIEENILQKDIVRQRVLNSYNNINENRRSFNMKKGMVLISSSLSVLFFIGVNTNKSFADAVYEIPLVGEIAKIITISDYIKEEDTNIISVKIPQLQETGNSELEKRINKSISEKVNLLASEAQKEAEMFLEGKEINKDTKIKINFDYDVKCSNDNVVSFVIKKTIDNPAYNFESEDVTFYNYNIDLKTGEDLSLEKILGSDYKNIVNSQIKEKMLEMSENDKTIKYFFDKYYIDKGYGDDILEDNQPFYINKNGNIVIVFYAGYIMPAKYGVQEFEIKV